ncbi:MAG: RNA polymerase sigma factor FliA [Pseudomonadota bacterium]
MKGQGISAYQHCAADTDALVREHADLVRRIALHLSARLPSSVQTDDLVQAGMIGLLEAARNFQSDSGASFSTYAGIRIRGAMVDEVRRGDWAPRSVHRHARQISEAISRLEAQLGREAEDAEVASALGVELSEYQRMLDDAATARLFSFDALQDEDNWDPVSANSDTLRAAEDLELRQRVARAIEALPERDQLVLNLYYEECLNLKEIGAVLSVSESRVSQIMSKATLRLKGLVAATETVASATERATRSRS